MRLFIALCLPDEALSFLTGIQDLLPGGRPVAEDNLHLTLAFCGEVDAPMAEAIHDALETVRLGRIALHLEGCALFGGRHGQAVAIAADGGAGLTGLHGRIRSRLHGASVPLERRRFRPHVTLARIPGRADAGPFAEVLNAAQGGPFEADRFALIQSTLHPDGAIHAVLAEYPLY